MTVDQTPSLSPTIPLPPPAPWPAREAAADEPERNPDEPQGLRFEPALTGWPRIFPGL